MAHGLLQCTNCPCALALAPPFEPTLRMMHDTSKCLNFGQYWGALLGGKTTYPTMCYRGRRVVSHALDWYVMHGVHILIARRDLRHGIGWFHQLSGLCHNRSGCGIQGFGWLIGHSVLWWVGSGQGMTRLTLGLKCGGALRPLSHGKVGFHCYHHGSGWVLDG